MGHHLQDPIIHHRVQIILLQINYIPALHILPIVQIHHPHNILLPVQTIRRPHQVFQTNQIMLRLALLIMLEIRQTLFHILLGTLQLLLAIHRLHLHIRQRVHHTLLQVRHTLLPHHHTLHLHLITHRLHLHMFQIVLHICHHHIIHRHPQAIHPLLRNILPLPRHIPQQVLHFLVALGTNLVHSILLQVQIILQHLLVIPPAHLNHKHLELLVVTVRLHYLK